MKLRSKLLVALLPALTAVIAATSLLMTATNPAKNFSARLNAANAQLKALTTLSNAVDKHRDAVAASALPGGEEYSRKTELALMAALADARTRAHEERQLLADDEGLTELREKESMARIERSLAEAQSLRGPRYLQALDDALQGPIERAIAEERSELDDIDRRLMAWQHSLRRWALAIGLSGVLLTSLASALLLRSVFMPIRRLSDATRRLAQGDFSVRVATSAGDELGELSRDFSAMAEQLERQHEALADRAARERAYAFQKEFLSLVTHELRSPLNSVQGFVELVLVRESGLSLRSQKNLALVLDAAGRMKSNIDEILELSRLEAGQLQIKPAPFEVAPVLSDLVENARALVRGREIQVKLEADRSVGQVISDEKRVRQILTNLLSNAAKFTQRGSITLKAWRDSERRAYFSVSDTGVGIPADQQSIIFEAFRQLGNEPGGTGLGLTIASRLVSLLHGEIALSSVVGQGSTFSVMLPERSDS